MTKKIFSILITLLFLSCASNIKQSRIGVVDLPVIVEYSARAYRENRKSNIEKSELYKFINSCIGSVARENNLEIVLNKKDLVVYHDEHIDVTVQVINEINKRLIVSSKSGK